MSILTTGFVSGVKRRLNSPPAQAVAAGYVNPVLIDDFSSNTFGTNWFGTNPYGITALTTGTTSASQAYISGGLLTVQTDNSGFGMGIVTATTSGAPTSSPSNRILTGSRLFQYGYYEFSAKFTQNGFTGSGDWPAIWFIDVTGVAAVYPHSEIDLLEAQPTPLTAGSPTVLTGTIHQWTNSSSSTTQGITTENPPGGFSYANFNTYGFLWQPNRMTWYINNQVTTMTSGGGAPNPVTVGAGTSFTTAGNPSFLTIGTGFNWPIILQFAHIWQ